MCADAAEARACAPEAAQAFVEFPRTPHYNARQAPRRDIPIGTHVTVAAASELTDPIQ